MSRFSELIAWHLDNGTRPTGVPETPGIRWSNKDFAAAVGGTNERTVRNWRSGRSPPYDLASIEREFFGDNRAYADWRRALRMAFDDLKNPTGVSGVSPDPVLPTPVDRSSGPTKPISLPYPSLGGLFTGRDAYLRQLRDSLLAGHATAIAGRALHGLGGVGKTRAAVEYAWRHVDDHSAVLFAVAETAEGLRSNLAQLAGALGLEDFAAANDEQRLAHALDWLRAHPGWLLILDNIDTADALAAVNALLGQLRGGHVIITSRLDNFPGNFTALALDVLAPDDATQFLLARTEGRRRNSAEDAMLARAIAVDDLGQLALALEQAGAYIARQRLGLAAYRALWQAESGAAQRWADASLMNYPRALATTFHVSIDRLAPAARVLLERLAFLGPEEVPDFLLDVAVPQGAAADPSPSSLVQGDARRAGGTEEGVDGRPSPTMTDVGPAAGEAAREALAELADYSLATRTEAGFTIHRVVQDATRRGLDAVAARQRLTEALGWLNAAFTGEPDDVRSWPRLDPLAPHAAAIAQRADQAGIAAPTARLLNQLGLLLNTKARHAEAEPLFRRALAIHEASLGPNHPSVATGLNNLASLLQDTNRLAEAEPLYRRALAIGEASLGPNHPYVATGLNNLALLLRATNRLAEAEPHYRRALAITEASLGPDHPNAAIGLNNLAELLRATNRLAEAEKLFARCLHILVAFQRATSHEHPQFQLVRQNYIIVLTALGRTEAEIAAALAALGAG